MNRSEWIDTCTWRDHGCVECDGTGAPCCAPPDRPPPPDTPRCPHCAATAAPPEGNICSMTEQHSTVACTVLWCPDCTRALDAMVEQMTLLYAHARGLPGRSVLTVHADEANDIFTLRIGVGRDAAAWLALHEWLTGASDGSPS